MKRLIYILFCMSIVAGCRVESLSEILTKQSEVSLFWRGEAQMLYSPDTHQIGFNVKEKVFRVYDDRLSEWFILKCSELPTYEGQEIVADLSWTAKRETKNYSGLSFRVEKTDQNGHIWLWNESTRIGIVIKDIQ